MADDERSVAAMFPFLKVPTSEQYAELFAPYGFALVTTSGGDSHGGGSGSGSDSGSGSGR